MPSNTFLKSGIVMTFVLLSTSLYPFQALLFKCLNHLSETSSLPLQITRQSPAYSNGIRYKALLLLTYSLDYLLKPMFKESFI